MDHDEALYEADVKLAERLGFLEEVALILADIMVQPGAPAPQYKLRVIGTDCAGGFRGLFFSSLLPLDGPFIALAICLGDAGRNGAEGGAWRSNLDLVKPPLKPEPAHDNRPTGRVGISRLLR
jgi:hypothetical protein